MRATFRLTAKHRGETIGTYIEADSETVPAALGDEVERLRFDATTTAIMYIMNRACQSTVWAQGASSCAMRPASSSTRCRRSPKASGETGR